MRVIVVGAGAIGGGVAAALAHSGADVLAVARGAHLQAIRRDGLHFQAHDFDRRVPLACVETPGEIEFRPDDAILICTKTQDTIGVLDDLRAAGVTDQPIFCFQNGVANERLALRRFPNVHGVLVMMPAQLVAPGQVATFTSPRYGMFDIGRFPDGVDASDEVLCALLNAAGFAAFTDDRVMVGKYGKLLLNLSNTTEALTGERLNDGVIVSAMIEEAKAAYSAAGIDWRDSGDGDGRRKAYINVTSLEGIPRQGSSTTQSLLRGAGSVETEYLNGEIVLLGRLHGVPTPVNAYVTDLADKVARGGGKPGDISTQMLMQQLGLD